MQIEHLPIDALIPYARNSRTHSEQQVAQIAASIREFGFTNPVLIDLDGGIIAGHGRVMGARQLGLSEVPCIRLGHLSDAQKRAYVIADNKLALNAGWDETMLALELRDLQAEGYDLGLTGFDTSDIDAMLASLDGTSEGNTDPDDVPPEPSQPVSITGDVWQLGPHRVMCGDSTSAVDVATLCNGARAKLIHADPPYGMGKEADGVANDNFYADKLDAFQMSWWRTFRAHVEPNASAYIWGNAPDLWRLWHGHLMASERLTFRNEIVWAKPNPQGLQSNTNRQYPPTTERCLFFMLGEQGFNKNADNYWEGWEPIRKYLADQVAAMKWTAADVKRITGVGMYSHWFTTSQWTFIPKQHYKALKTEAENQAFKRDYDALKRDFYATLAYFDNTHEAMTDVFEYSVVTNDDRHNHATPKPVAMMERVMKTSLPPAGLCLEPFGGSGSTLMGAERTGRTCYTMELQPRYVDTIITRWQNYTGQEATLAVTGKTFEQVRQDRLGLNA